MCVNRMNSFKNITTSRDSRETVAINAVHNGVVECMDINLYEYRNNKMYDGDTEKFGVTINSIDYIVKLPKSKMDTSVYSEYVASSFIRGLGYESHETLLCKNNDEVVVLMKDFTMGDFKLRSYKDTGQSSEDTDITTILYTYGDVLYMIENHTKIKDVNKKEVILSFWDMFMLDAILGNRDRHRGNWGYLSDGVSYRIAPIYDNGSSLFPDVSVNLNGHAEDRYKFLFERAERFPASLLCVYSKELGRAKRTNYYEFIEVPDRYFGMYDAYTKLLKKGYKAVRSTAVNAVDNILIPDTLKRFYIDIICIRYMHIIERFTIEDSYRRLLYGE